MTSKLIGSAFAAAILLASCGSVAAAELVPLRSYKAPPFAPGSPVAPYFNWSGFYFGLNAGHAWARARWDAPPPLDFDTAGGLFGITAGYNVQGAGWLFGIEGDYSWTRIAASTACGFASCETHNNWLATVRGRIGMPIDRFLPYVTGGLAFGDITAGNSNAGFGTASTEKVGWTAGAGFEYALTGLVSAKVEYLHVNLGTFDCGRACSVAGSDNVSWSANILRGGINFKFNAGGLTAKY